MAKFGKCDYKLLKELQKKVDRLKGDDFNAFCESCAKELAARLLRKVIKRTQPGEYPEGSGKVGGTLRHGWTTSASGDSTHDTQQAMYSSMFGGTQKVSKAQMTVNKIGDNYVIEVINPVYYASYVEFGHRTRNHEGWVKGKFMLTISERELQAQAPAILERKLMKFLGEVFNG